MLVHNIVLVVFGYTILAATVWLVRRLVKNPKTRYDLQRDAYLAHRSFQVAVALLQAGTAVLTVVMGIAFIDQGYFFGWAFFAFAGVPVVYLALKIYIVRLPFTYPEDL